MKRFFVILFAMLMVATLFMGSVWALGIYQDSNRKKKEEIPLETQTNTIKETADKERMLEETSETVVGLSATTYKGSPFLSKQTEIIDMGSGVIVSDDGYILTNMHVIKNSPNKVSVTLNSGDTLTASMVWGDELLDIAIIKMNGENFRYSKLIESNSLNVGDTVYAIGNPLGMQFERTITKGIISAVSRTVAVETNGATNYIEDLIQTDASINPGNSGGPLINENGEVVGINTVKITTAEALGFAIPSDLYIAILQRIKREPDFKMPYIGLHGYTSKEAKYLKIGSGFTKGIYVFELDEYSAGYKSGIKKGDILESIENNQINSMTDLRKELVKHSVGDEIEVSIKRGNDSKVIKVTLGEK